MVARKNIPIARVEQEHICKNCRAVHCSRAKGLRCRRHPPVFVYDPATGASSAEWPEVNADDWCLDFAPQLSS